MFRTTRAWVILLVVGLLVASCARSPEAQKARHLERGDKYVAREQYREAQRRSAKTRAGRMSMSSSVRRAEGRQICPKTETRPPSVKALA
jgi:hypothetical protein